MADLTKLRKPPSAPAVKEQPPAPAMRVAMRIAESDGTPDGITLWVDDDVIAAAIPREYARLRVHNREGLYEVVEGGVLYYYAPGNIVAVTIVTQRVDVEEEDEG